jgi:oligoribonuclease
MNLFWLDLETSGLNPQIHRILEAAVVVTDENLNELFGISTLIDANLDAVEWLPSAREIHTANRLIEDLKDPSIPKLKIEQLSEWLLEIANAFGCTKTESSPGSPLCGSTVSFDRSFLKLRAAAFLDQIDYHNVDVSSIHELAKRWYSHHHSDIESTHRALPDIRFSIERLAWYRRHIFSPYARIREGHETATKGFPVLDV